MYRVRIVLKLCTEAEKQNYIMRLKIIRTRGFSYFTYCDAVRFRSGSEAFSSYSSRTFDFGSPHQYSLTSITKRFFSSVFAFFLPVSYAAAVHLVDTHYSSVPVQVFVSSCSLVKCLLLLYIVVNFSCTQCESRFINILRRVLHSVRNRESFMNCAS